MMEFKAKEKPKTLRGWVARKLIAAARRLDPRDDGVMADLMTDVIRCSMEGGAIRTTYVPPEDMRPADFEPVEMKTLPEGRIKQAREKLSKLAADRMRKA